MRKFLFVIHFLVVMMMISALNVWAAQDQKKTGYMDDTMITAKIKSKLATDDYVKATDINVETQNGVVQLSGFVDSQKAQDRAGQIAQSVKGVKSVKNNIIVQKEKDMDQRNKDQNQDMSKSQNQDKVIPTSR